jgi:glycosyltransferase involved in cell wall biosynthesis
MLRPVKRPDLVLDALLLLPEQDRPDLMVFAGDGVMMPGMTTRVRSDPWLRDHVLLLGMVPDSPAFLAAIDFLVLASDTEGLPNAIIEAMAAGIPCVATRVSDVPDLVTDNGWVVPPNDAASLADAMRNLRHMDRAARHALGERGRSRAIEAFGLAAAAKRFWDAHDLLLREAEPRP